MLDKLFGMWASLPIDEGFKHLPWFLDLTQPGYHSKDNVFNTRHVANQFKSVINSTLLSAWDLPENCTLAGKPCLVLHFSLLCQQIARQVKCEGYKFPTEVSGIAPTQSQGKSSPSFKVFKNEGSAHCQVSLLATLMSEKFASRNHWLSHSSCELLIQEPRDCPPLYQPRFCSHISGQHSAAAWGTLQWCIHYSLPEFIK